mgnify:CR=1 FL=1
MAYSTNLAWIIVIFLIILFVVFAIWLYNSPPGSEFGQYGPPVTGPCEGTSGICSDTGERIVTQECLINEQTGKGCIGPDGEQSYDLLVTKEPCNLTCRSAVWENVTDPNKPCTPPDSLPGEMERDGRYCLPTIYPEPLANAGQPVTGTRILTYRCVPNDSTGPNNCSKLALETIVGPTNISGLFNQLTVAEIGEEVMTNPANSTCAIVDENIPVCGQWEYFTPFQPRVQPVRSKNQLSACTFFSSLDNEATCQVPGGITPFNLLREGIYLSPMACVTGTGQGDVATIPTDTEDSLVDCLQSQQYIDCNTSGFLSTDIAEKSLASNIIDNPFVCNNAQNNDNFANNPRCLRPCRLYPVPNPNLGNPTWNALVNAPFIMYRGSNYVSAFQIPRTDSQLVKFSNSKTIPGQILMDTPLLMVPFGFSQGGPRPNCTDEQLAFNSGVIGLFGPENISGNTLLAKFNIGISSIYSGWLTQNTFSGLGKVSAWEQGYTAYNGPGATYDQSSSYQITIISPFDNTPVSGYPNSIGQTTLRIRSSSDDKLAPIVLNDGNQEEVFEEITLILFNFSKVNFNSRNDQSSDNCNIFNSTINTPQGFAVTNKNFKKKNRRFKKQR